MASRNVIFASPVLCLGVLTVIAADNARHVRPQDAAPYHARAKSAIDAFPYIIGYWTGSDEAVPEAAVKLLRPNALLSRRYENHSPRLGNHAGWAELLISQCADSRDMIGHYPPICYPSSGEPQTDARPFRVKAGDLYIDGIEYQFSALPESGIERKSVYNFFVVPGRGIVPDIGGVRRVSGDYQRRCFGAAQFQVVMDADQSPESRDEVFAALIGSDTAVIKALEDAK
jgi:hypothetical protein